MHPLEIVCLPMLVDVKWFSPDLPMRRRCRNAIAVLLGTEAVQACQMLCVAVAGPSVAATQRTTGLKCLSLNDNCFLPAHSLSPCASPVSDEIAASVRLAQSYTLWYLCHIV